MPDQRLSVQQLPIHNETPCMPPVSQTPPPNASLSNQIIQQSLVEVSSQKGEPQLDTNRGITGHSRSRGPANVPVRFSTPPAMLWRHQRCRSSRPCGSGAGFQGELVHGVPGDRRPGVDQASRPVLVSAAPLDHRGDHVGRHPQVLFTVLFNLFLQASSHRRSSRSSTESLISL